MWKGINKILLETTAFFEFKLMKDGTQNRIKSLKSEKVQIEGELALRARAE